MTQNAINLIRSYTASRWSWLRVCWRSRALVAELVEHYEKAEAKANAADNDRFASAVKAEVLQHELDDLRQAHTKERGGNAALRKFIELNHKPTMPPKPVRK